MGNTNKGKVMHVSMADIDTTTLVPEPRPEKSRPTIVATVSACIYVLPTKNAVRIENRDFIILYRPRSTVSVYISVFPEIRASEMFLSVGGCSYGAEFLQKVELPFEEWPLQPKPERQLWELRLPLEAFASFSYGDTILLKVKCLNTQTSVDVATPTYIKVEIVNVADAPIEQVYLTPQEEWDNRETPFSVMVRATTGRASQNINTVHVSTWSKLHTRSIGSQAEKSGLLTKGDMGTVIQKPHRDRICGATIPLHTTAEDPAVAESPPIIFGDGIEQVIEDEAARIPAVEDGLTIFDTDPGLVLYNDLEGTSIPVRVLIFDDTEDDDAENGVIVESGCEMAEGAAYPEDWKLKLCGRPEDETKTSIEKIIKKLNAIKGWNDAGIAFKIYEFPFNGENDEKFIVTVNFGQYMHKERVMVREENMKHEERWGIRCHEVFDQTEKDKGAIKLVKDGNGQIVKKINAYKIVNNEPDEIFLL